MPIQNVAIVTYDNDRVVEGSLAEIVVSFVQAADYRDLMCFRGLAKGIEVTGTKID
jgi:hypothetical protein